MDYVERLIVRIVIHLEVMLKMKILRVKLSSVTTEIVLIVSKKDVCVVVMAFVMNILIRIPATHLDTV